ncbi:MAG: glycosyltransferase family 2 protein [Mycobacterium sp.]|nr:glycosyltransferase family 2 protein [Mycobacterium sp.]
MTESHGHIRRTLLICVTFNSSDSLPDLTSTIDEFDRDHPGNHVMVVENSADTDIKQVIESQLGSRRVHVEVAARNEGFSHGVNLGYRLAQRRWGQFDFVVLLNPDVVAAGKTVCELVNRSAEPSESEFGLWGAVLKDERGQIDRGCARRVWNRRRLFSHVVGYPNLAKLLLSAPRNLTPYEIAYERSELAMVSGALMCMRADVLQDGLDTRLPMYLEDQEICLRCIRKGHKVRLYPDLEAIHLGGVSRKSISKFERPLRIMELVESPVQCMRICQEEHHGLAQLRLVVFSGGILRFAAAPVIAVAKIASRKADVASATEWMGTQLRLSSWFVSWAIKGRFHTADISLSDYFDEYGVVR